MKDLIENLAKKAAEQYDACQAQQFAQAALNLANAQRVMADTARVSVPSN